MEKITERILSFNKDYPSDRMNFKLATMSKNAFRFYRATNHVFCEDITRELQRSVCPCAWISGDLHLENFGTYKSENRLVYFDLNDFDEAVLAPVTFELVRMITGIFTAFHSLGIEETKALNISKLFLDSYARNLERGKPIYVESQTTDGLLKTFILSAKYRQHTKMVAKKTTSGKRGVRLSLEYKSHIKLSNELNLEIIEHITKWLKRDDRSPYNYKAVDAVFRLAGAGSVGVNRYVVLLKSLNSVGEKYMLLDMKQARASSLSPFIQNVQPEWLNEAERVVNIQTRMQNRSPALLSTSVFRDEAYIIQEMQPSDDKIDFRRIKDDYREMCRIITEMGALTAAAQLRSAGREGSAVPDDLIHFGMNADWKQDLLQYAIEFSHQMRTYYADFLKDYSKLSKTQFPLG